MNLKKSEKYQPHVCKVYMVVCRWECVGVCLNYVSAIFFTVSYEKVIFLSKFGNWNFIILK